LIALLLWWATQALRRPFAEPQWVESEPRRKLWPRAAGARRGGQAARRELPFLAYLGFTNPVLQRELRSKFRLRRQPLWIAILAAVGSAFVLYWYCKALWWATSLPSWREGIWITVTIIGLLVVNIAAAVMGAGAFSHEREGGTWEALQLSLLSPRAIIWGKLLPPLLACIVYSIPLWPLLFLCTNTTSETKPPYGWQNNGVSMPHAVSTILIILSTVWCYTALGMWFSWRCRRTAGALSWTIGSALFILIFIPAFLLPNTRGPNDPVVEAVRLWHPYLAMAVLFDRGNTSRISIGLSSGLALFVMGYWFLFRLRYAMRNGMRVPD
jgi:ABC-type transport system involved in multi-copper enzyme maturation permease subunit